MLIELHDLLSADDTWYWEHLDTSWAWNSHQGPQLQWLGPSDRHMPLCSLSSCYRPCMLGSIVWHTHQADHSSWPRLKAFKALDCCVIQIHVLLHMCSWTAACGSLFSHVFVTTSFLCLHVVYRCLFVHNDQPQELSWAMLCFAEPQGPLPGIMLMLPFHVQVHCVQ